VPTLDVEKLEKEDFEEELDPPVSCLLIIELIIKTRTPIIKIIETTIIAILGFIFLFVFIFFV